MLRSIEESNSPQKAMVSLDLEIHQTPSQPCFTKLTNKEGKRVGPRRNTETIAEYLEDVQWKQGAHPPARGRISAILPKLAGAQ